MHLRDSIKDTIYGFIPQFNCFAFGYVYRTTNLINGKTYVGQRKGGFDTSYLGSGRVLKNAVAKYGIGNFEVVPIVVAQSQTDLDEKEKTAIVYEIDSMGKGQYNIVVGVWGGDTFSRQSEEDKQRIRKVCGSTQRGVKWTDERKKKVSTSLSGKVRSEETLKKLRDSHLGQKVSDETRAFMSARFKGISQSDKLSDMRIASRYLNGKCSLTPRVTLALNRLEAK